VLGPLILGPEPTTLLQSTPIPHASASTMALFAAALLLGGPIHTALAQSPRAPAPVSQQPSRHVGAKTPELAPKSVEAWRKAVLAGQFDVARALLKTPAERGDATAQYHLGSLLIDGNGGEIDLFTGAKWMTAAAAQGDGSAQYRLGALYLRGRGVARSTARAFELFSLAAVQGAVEAQFNLGFMHANALGTARSLAAARQWYRSAAKQGHARAQHNLALMLLQDTGARRPEGLKWLRSADSQGLNEASVNLGLVLSNAHHPAYDYAGAIVALQDAALRGHARAAYLLGQMFHLGSAAKQDLPAAIQWYERAVEHGHAGAQFNLAVLLEQALEPGQGMRPIWTLYRAAARQGHVNAQVNLAALYARRDLALDDISRAVAWWTVASNSGSDKARENLASIQPDLSKTGVMNGVTLAERWLQDLPNADREPPDLDSAPEGASPSKASTSPMECDVPSNSSACNAASTP
jgi:TPR repeat protein